MFNLFSNGRLYDAVVKAEDSMLMNDGSYHHIRGLLGIGYYDWNNNYQTDNWDINWHERGLCAGEGLPNATDSVGYGAGGVQYNFPDHLYFCLCSIYSGPKPHTIDYRYNLSDLMDTCMYIGTNNLAELTNQKLNAYPNPTNGTFNIDFSGDAKVIQIRDLRGLVVKEFDFVPTTIDITEFTPGSYFLHIESRSGVNYQAKIVKTD